MFSIYRCVFVQKSSHPSTLLTSILHRALSSSNNDLKLGFVGTGRIAQAIIIGLIKKEKLRPDQIYASDSNKENLKFLKEKCPIFNKYKINFLSNNSEVFKHTDTVMVCVKPKDVTNLLKEVSNTVNKNHLVLSIAAGIQIQQVEKCLPKDTRVIRIMTNITALIQQSCSVFSRGKNATKDDAECVKSLLEAIGTCEDEINEDLMDVVTALSGSGPAYMCVILDALADGAVKMGMSRRLALRLAAQTMLGSAKMVVGELDKEFGRKHIMEMKEEVCSAGGTTIYGISELEDHRFRSALIKCVESGTNRAKELNPKN